MGITTKSLDGGSLQVVMASSMFADTGARARFDKASKKADAKPLAAWNKAFGWAPPTELAEWEGVKGAYRKLVMEISDVWMIGGTLAFKPVPIETLLTGDGVMTLLTGLLHFGDDPSGDSCFVSTLPSPDGLARIHVYDHETGELGSEYRSIAQFVFENWNESAKRDRTAAKKLPVEHDPRALFERMKWLWGLPLGEPMYGFAEDIAKAPDFATWEKEKKSLAKNPVIANYWMLAHYFLGNHAACAEAVAIGKQVPGTYTPALAKIVAQLLAQPAKAKLGKVTAKKLVELRAAAAKNADEKLLEPALRANVAKSRAIAGPTADAILAALVKEDKSDGRRTRSSAEGDAKVDDKSLKPLIERFEQQRGEDVYDVWPSAYDLRKGPLDRRILPAVAAAFRAGLAFDVEHKRSASSFVHTLAYFDDDTAMDAFAAAVEACKMNDARLQHLVAAVRQSKHPRALGILARAAWRFFEFFEATKESIAKQKKRGPTLDDLFKVHSHLLPALVWRIRVGDDESEKLVDKVCSILENMTVLGVAYSAAFQQVGNKKLERHTRLVEAYCKSMLALTGEHLAADAKYNLAEAAIAYAKLQPAAAKALLRPVLDDTAGPRRMRLDKIGCALGGLLLLVPEDPAVLEWTERILGNRTGAERVYGALRGVAEARLVAAKPWLAWHVYHGTSSNHIGEKPMIMRAASQALVALGEPEPPPFDEGDEFANKRSDAELPSALRDRHKHLLDWTFKRIVERELRSPEVVRAAGDILREHYRFSHDDDDRSNDRDRVEGLACMVQQGEPALPELASILALPHMAGGEKTVIVHVMSIIADAPALFVRLANAPAAQILAALEPTPENIGNLDLAAGYALATLGDDARPAIEAAHRWRMSLVDPDEQDHWIEQEPTANGLAAVVERMKAKQPTPLVGMDGQPSRRFEQRLREHGGVRYTCTLEVTGRSVAITLGGDDIYVQGVLPNARYEQTATVAAASADAAMEMADRIARGLSAVGFAALAPAKPDATTKKGAKAAKKKAKK